jgi:PilZ domain-containing protein
MPLTESRHYSRRLAISPPAQIKSERRMRRSKRVKLSVSVVVHGKAVSGETCRELTRTLTLSAHGGLLTLAANVQKEQTILVENKHTRKQQECRVVYVSPGQHGKWSVGVEFTREATDFWQICFPPLISS